MTRREQIDRNKRGIMIVALCAFAIVAVGTIWTRMQAVYSPVPVLLGTVILGLAMFYGWFKGLRCPSCRESWYSLAMGSGPISFRIDKRIRYCPYCGCDIDA
jgi:hypothetical protein